jgi:hypothetical protein
MMMVDTINPNTNEPDSFGGTSPQNPLEGGTNLGDGRFFSGFDQPDNVKVNLATPTPGEQPSSTMDSLSNGPVLRPAEPAPSTQPLESHSTYARSSSSGVNWRGVFVIAFLGIFLSGVISGITWFAISSSSKKALNTTSSELAKLESELASLNETPEPLELPSEVAEVPASPTPETPVTPATPTPTETETETPTTPAPTTPQVETAEKAGTNSDGSNLFNG